MTQLSTQFERVRSGRSRVAVTYTVACTIAATTATILPARLGAQTQMRAPGPSASAASTRAVATDPRWYAWLGCWEADTSGTASTKCIVPAAGTNTVEELTLVNGNVVARDRLDISGRPHQIRQQGCDGSESVNWSASGRRVFLRSDYTCTTGIKGTSTRMFAILPDGDWIEVENVKAGSGALVHATRRHDAAPPAGAPREVTAFAGTQQLAVSAARANAAAPLSTEDVLEALHTTDAATVRTWLVATNQGFDLDAQQVNALVQEDVPTTVLQAMMSAVPSRQLGLSPMRSQASDEYLNTQVYVPAMANQAMPVIYAAPESSVGSNCTPMGCTGANMYSPYNYNNYSPYNGAGYYPFSPYSSYVPYPIFGASSIVRRGHDGFGRSFPTHQTPVSRRPVGRRP